MNFASWKIKAICAIALVAFIAGSGAGAGWWFTKTACERDISALKDEHGKEREGWLKEKLVVTTKAQQDTTEAIERMKAAQEDLARLDAETQRKLADAEMENETLSRDVASGNRRLRILGTKLANSGGNATGGDSVSSCMGDGADAELSPEAGRAVFDLRSGIIRKEAQLAALQDYVEKVVRQCKR